MSKTKTPEEEFDERIKICADAIEFFIENPESLENMQNKVSRAYVKKMLWKLEKALNEKQTQLVEIK